MIQRFYATSSKKAYIIIDHANHVYNYYTNPEDADQDAYYIPAPLTTIKKVLEDIIQCGYEKADYQI